MRRRSGIITLLTDFGDQDPFVGVMRGVIYGRFRRARIVDLTHRIAPQRVAEAAFWLERAYRYFQRGTVHVAVVDPGVGTARAILAAKVSGHLFLAPDNGLLGPVLRSGEDPVVFEIDLDALVRLGIKEWSATFHGRDLFAPIAAELARGGLKLSHIGTRADLDGLVPSPLAEPLESEGRVEGSVAVVDRFGNLITNISSRAISRLGVAEIDVAGKAIDLLRTYGEGAPGEIIAVVGSFDRLEIARVGGSAAEALKTGAGEKVTVRGAHRAP